MSKILFLNQPQAFNDDRIPPLSDFNPNYKWKEFAGFLEISNHSNGLYWRTGKNNLPFKNDLIQHMGFSIPDYDPNFNLSFELITDKLVQDLWQAKKDKPWLIYWSGGVDSTVIVTAILKNLSPADWSNVVIACNQICVVENSRFFYNHIRPNFQIIDSSQLKINKKLLEKYYLFNGDLADQLFGYNATGLLDNGGASLLKDFRRDPDELMDIMKTQAGKDSVEWSYEIIKENIDSTNIPVVTYSDFFWWQSFNLPWAGMKLREFHVHGETRYISADLFLENFMQWYDTPEYQQWAMHRKLDVTFSINIAQRKLALKKYVYEFDRDEYYFHFKCKSSSVGRSIDLTKIFFCLLDDGRTLYLDRDLEEILTLLPEHINH